jgi:uncharacterized protein YcaQ
VPVALVQLRRLAVAAQAYGAAEHGDEDDVEAVVKHLSAVQLDPIAVVARSERTVIGARTGSFARDAIGSLLARGRLFEYWAHEASLLPVDAYPLVRWRMTEPVRWATLERALSEHPGAVDEVLTRLRAEGPLPLRAFAGRRTEGGWKLERDILGALWHRGEVAIAGRSSDQRVFDLAERVLSREVLEAPPLGETELLRALALRAVRARGVLTEAAIREHWRLKGGRSRLQPHLDALVAEGELRELAVEDGGPPVYVTPDAELDAEPADIAVLLSPFDNLLWDRPLAERLFGFQHVIEIYKRAPERRYGYYVLPLLWRDRLVARADLKRDRKAEALAVLAFHREPGLRASRALEGAFEQALTRLARVVGAASITR